MGEIDYFKVSNYQETLDLVENFMVKSGIRKYCSTVCKGKCCTYPVPNTYNRSTRHWEEHDRIYCYESKNACHKNEGKRLPCTIFMCRDLAEAVVIGHRKSLMLSDCRIFIIGSYHRTLRKAISVYFKPHPNRSKLLKNFHIKSWSLEVLKDEKLMRSVKRKVRLLGNKQVIIGG